jgi:hypothetical protein
MKGNIMITFDYTDNNVVDNNQVDNSVDNKLFTKVNFGSKTFIKIDMDMFRELKANEIVEFPNYGLSSQGLNKAKEFYIDVNSVKSITKSPEVSAYHNDKFYYTVDFNFGDDESAAYIIFSDTKIFESFIQLL